MHSSKSRLGLGRGSKDGGREFAQPSCCVFQAFKTERWKLSLRKMLAPRGSGPEREGRVALLRLPAGPEAELGQGVRDGGGKMLQEGLASRPGFWEEKLSMGAGISPTSGSLKPPGRPGPGALRGPGRAVPSPRSPGCYRPEPNGSNSDCSWGTRGGRGGGGGDSGRREGETGTFGVEGELATLGGREEAAESAEVRGGPKKKKSPRAGKRNASLCQPLIRGARRPKEVRETPGPRPWSGVARRGARDT